MYWRQNQSEQIYGLSLSSSSDLDRFCSAVNQCLPPTPPSSYLNQKQTKMENNEERSNIGRTNQLRAILMELVSSERAFVQDLQKVISINWFKIYDQFIGKFYKIFGNLIIHFLLF